jgi:3D (Asp-Asp-Asp) domain-containing protein
MLRGQVSNAADATRVIAIGSGVYVPGTGRQASVYLTTIW